MEHQRKSVSVQYAKSLKSCWDLEYILIGDLRQLLDEGQLSKIRMPLLVIINRLLQNLPDLLRLSSEDGFIATVPKICPRFHRQIQTLQRVNLECINSLQGLHDHIDNKSNFIDVSKETDGKLRDWITAFGKMRSRESELLQEAYTVDIGGEA